MDNNMNTSPSNILDSISGIDNLDSLIDYNLDKVGSEGGLQKTDKFDQIIDAFKPEPTAPPAGAIQDGKMTPEQLAEFDAKRAKTQEEFDNANRNFQEQRGALATPAPVTEPTAGALTQQAPAVAPVVAPAVDPRNNPNPKPFADQTIAPEEKAELEKKAEETAAKLQGTTLQEKLDNLSKVFETRMSEAQKVKYNQLSPEQSKNVQLRFFLSLMEHGSKKNATFVGSVGAAGREALDAKRVITQQNNLNEEKRYSNNIANIKDVTKMDLKKFELAVNEKKWAAQLEKLGGRGASFMSDEMGNAYVVGRNGVAVAIVTSDGKPLKMKKTAKEGKDVYPKEEIYRQKIEAALRKDGKGTDEDGNKIQYTENEIESISRERAGMPPKPTKLQKMLSQFPAGEVRDKAELLVKEAKKLIKNIGGLPGAHGAENRAENITNQLRDQLANLAKQ
tara:strand:- start:17195 stop:18541 length:1347 start_codon:yes stop_codon:yes gene_type:complete